MLRRSSTFSFLLSLFSLHHTFTKLISPDPSFDLISDPDVAPPPPAARHDWLERSFRLTPYSLPELYTKFAH